MVVEIVACPRIFSTTWEGTPASRDRSTSKKLPEFCGQPATY
jgi:hypothetical protein